MSTTASIHAMTADAYHDDPCDTPSLSSTIARILCTSSPRHAWTAHPRLNPDYTRTESDKFDIGTVCHALLLQGIDVVEVIDAADWRTKAAQTARDEARAGGRVPLLAKQVDQVAAMLDAIRPQLAAVHADPPIFTDGTPEQTLIWQEHGITCRARLDWLHNDHRAIDDLKTTSRSANPEQWTRSLFGTGYDVQAAFYLRGLRALTGADAEFRFAVVECYPPYALSVIGLTPGVLELANEKVDHAISVWRDCLERGEWPAYPLQVCYAELPAWEETRWLEREARAAA